MSSASNNKCFRFCCDLDRKISEDPRFDLDNLEHTDEERYVVNRRGQHFYGKDNEKYVKYKINYFFTGFWESLISLALFFLFTFSFVYFCGSFVFGVSLFSKKKLFFIL